MYSENNHLLDKTAYLLSKLERFRRFISIELYLHREKERNENRDASDGEPE